MKILLVAGHGQGDPGAQGGGFTERETMRQLVTKIKNLIPNVVDLYDMSLDCYQQNGLATTPYKEVIEFHMDGAGNTQARGGHVIIATGFNPDDLDNRLKDAIKKQIGIWMGRPTGFSYRDDLQNLNVAKRRGISYRLLELGFITNIEDRTKAIGDMDTLAILLAEAISGKTIANGSNVQSNAIAQGHAEPAKSGLSYRSHIQTSGWLGYVYSGVTSGTTGKHLRMEAVEILIDNKRSHVGIEAHVQSYGWLKEQYGVVGTVGQAKRLEAVKLRLVSDLAKTHDIVYRVHVQGIGWMPWVKNGAVAGTTGKALRMEAIEIKLVGK